jgi:hypothetical protein
MVQNLQQGAHACILVHWLHGGLPAVPHLQMHIYAGDVLPSTTDDRESANYLRAGRQASSLSLRPTSRSGGP